jgi:hypothetical protein
MSGPKDLPHPAATQLFQQFIGSDLRRQPIITAQPSVCGLDPFGIRQNCQRIVHDSVSLPHTPDGHTAIHREASPR